MALTSDRFVLPVFTGDATDGFDDEHRRDLRIAMYTTCAMAHEQNDMWEIEASPADYTIVLIGANLPDNPRKKAIAEWLERLNDADGDHLKWFMIGAFFAVPAGVRVLD
jgi:hypothetical protein